MKKLKYIALALSLFLLTSCAKKNNEKNIENNTNQKIEENKNPQDNNKESTSTQNEGLIPEETKESSKALDKKEISFETFDLDGNKKNSKDLFNKNYNILYFWTTNSENSINMLNTLNEIKEDNINIYGIVLDVDENNSMNIEDAKNILTENKIEFTNLQTNPLIKEFSKDINSVPTSFIVDKNGNLVSELYIGTRDAKFFIDEISKLK